MERVDKGVFIMQGSCRPFGFLRSTPTDDRI
ncbi:hypothetical protein BPC006_II0117 [Burkholderia pseudomallei BPC006]|nr:hypothetical protein BPC006_II0117 [Burkholderia pseudomallei BPC006]